MKLVQFTRNTSGSMMHVRVYVRGVLRFDSTCKIEETSQLLRDLANATRALIRHNRQLRSLGLAPTPALVPSVKPTRKRISPADLKSRVQATGSHFFERKSMRFFGDTMRNYAVGGPITIDTPSGDQPECWVLRRVHAVKHGLCSDAYFDCQTFERRHAKA
jgi:hypothetical protein